MHKTTDHTPVTCQKKIKIKEFTLTEYLASPVALETI